MAYVYELSFWRHPVRVTNLAVRAAVLRGLRALYLRDDHNATHPISGDFESGEVPKGLQQFEVGEALPWKGVWFKVGKVVGGDLPCVILVPTNITKGTKLRTLRTFRDVARMARKGA